MRVCSQATVATCCRLFACFCTAFIVVGAVPGQVAAAESQARLADAAQRQAWDEVQALLDDGKVEINAGQPDGMTALLWATHHDNTRTVKRLIAAGADVRQANRYGVQPLSPACTNGNAVVVAALLAAGADPNTELRGGETALMTASRTGRTEPVAALLRHGAEVRRKLPNGQTALMWAAAEGHADVVGQLLDAGADRDAALDSGFNPMFFAARQGHVAVVRRLLKAGADVRAAMKVVRRRGGGKSPAGGTTALHLAVENGHFELALELIEAGADPNDQRGGYTPLHMITWVRKPNRGDGPDGDPAPRGSGTIDSLTFVRRLVARGADVNRRLKRGKSGRGRLNRTGATPLLLAAKTADLPLLRLLLKLGADPKITNASDSTPLMAAAGLGTLAPTEEAGTEAECMAAVRLLLELGADINAVDANGETAMHGAAYKSLPQVVRQLAASGADVDVWTAKNKYGWSPVMIAEGHRVGNFKPSAETLAAIHLVLRQAGRTPPPPTPRKKRKGYK